MSSDRKWPAIGLGFFDELRRINGYHVDETGMIGELLQNPAKVILILRCGSPDR